MTLTIIPFYGKGSTCTRHAHLDHTWSSQSFQPYQHFTILPSLQQWGRRPFKFTTSSLFLTHCEEGRFSAFSNQTQTPEIKIRLYHPACNNTDVPPRRESPTVHCLRRLQVTFSSTGNLLSMHSTRTHRLEFRLTAPSGAQKDGFFERQSSVSQSYSITHPSPTKDGCYCIMSTSISAGCTLRDLYSGVYAQECKLTREPK